MTAAKEAAPLSAEAQRWARSTFTDDQLVVLFAHLTQQKPAAKTPKDIRDRVIALAGRKGLTVAEAKDVLRKAMAPATGAAKPQPARNPPKDSPKQRPNPGAPPKHPAPGKAKVASMGQSKPDVILNAIKAPGGASLTALMGLTGWQAHSVRGAIATLRTKGKHDITSSKHGTERRYRLEQAKKVAAAAAPAKRAPRKVAGKKRAR